MRAPASSLGCSPKRSAPTGKVYAVDIAPQFLAHIAAEAKKRGQSQVVTVLGSQESTNLPGESVDLVFLCDVYHHLEKPEKTLASIRQALKPEGRLVVIDFDRVEGRSSAFVLKHVRARQDVFRKEIEAAGFWLNPENAPAFKENFFLRFRKAVQLAQANCGIRGGEVPHRMQQVINSARHPTRPRWPPPCGWPGWRTLGTTCGPLDRWSA